VVAALMLPLAYTHAHKPSINMSGVVKNVFLSFCHFAIVPEQFYLRAVLPNLLNVFGQIK
jgi:hypothetical protein